MRAALIAAGIVALVCLCGIGGLALHGGGDSTVAYDPYAGPRADLAWDSAQFFDTLGRVFWGSVVFVFVVVLTIGTAALATGYGLWTRGTVRKQNTVWSDGKATLPVDYQWMQANPQAAIALLMGAQQVALMAAQASRMPNVTHYTNNRTLMPGYEPDALPEAPAPLQLEAGLPGRMELGDVLAQGWHPSAQSILLGVGPGGKLITVPAGDALCHIVFAGPTGVGKTNLMRLFLTQLLAAGCQVALLDPHFTPQNPTTGEDWRAIGARVGGGRGPLVDKAAILAALSRLASEELPRRLEAWHTGHSPGPPYFIAIEEAPALADYDKRFMEYVRPLLREGRKLGLYVIMAAQDMLVSSLGTSAGVRAQFQTCYYGGGEPYSARALLGQTVDDPPDPPGVVWLKARPCKEPTLIRVPLVNNATIDRLLGPGATIVDEMTRPWETGRFAAEPPATPAEPPERGEPPEPDSLAQAWAAIQAGERTAHGLPIDQQEALAYRLWLQGAGKTKTLALLYKVSRGDNAPYQAVSPQWDAWLANWQAGQVPGQEAA